MRMVPAAQRQIGGLIAFVFSALATIGTAAATSANTDVTDIWWNALKAGTGYQFVNVGATVFATGYVYGANRQPFWASAELARAPGNSVTYTGPLYVNTGPYYGGASDQTVTQRLAGTMTFVLTSVSTGDLDYTIDGTNVSMPLTRFPFGLDGYNGVYRSVMTITVTNCSDPTGNFTGTRSVDINIAQNGTQMTQVWAVSGGSTCTYSGTYSQKGRMGSFTSTAASCAGAGASSDTLTMYQMTNEPYMYMARMFVANSANGCTIDGEVVGVQPRPE
jgi:hypothetical protein